MEDINEDRRNVLKSLGAALAPVGTVTARAESDYEAADVEQYLSGDSDEEQTASQQEFQLHGHHDIVADFRPIDGEIMYDDVDTTVLLDPDEDEYAVEVTYDTELEFYRWPTENEFAVYDGRNLDLEYNKLFEFARLDADDENTYSFERVFFNEWFNTVSHIEQILDGYTQIGIEQFGLEDERFTAARGMEPQQYRLQVHGSGGGKFHLCIPGDAAPQQNKFTDEALDTWTEIVTNPVHVMGGRRV